MRTLVLILCVFLTTFNGLPSNTLSAYADQHAELASETKLRIIAEENNAPWTFGENGKAKGYVSEIVIEILSRLGIEKPEIEIQPWVRAYNNLTQGPNTMIFSVGRTPDREDLFHWVGPIHISEAYLYAQAGSGIIIDSIEKARKIETIGTHHDSAGEIILKSQGFTNLESVPDNTQNLQKLLSGRINLMIGAPPAMKERLSKINETMSAVEPVFMLYSNGDYMAFSKDIDPSIVEQWQNILDELRAEGFLEAAVIKWKIK